MYGVAPCTWPPLDTLVDTAFEFSILANILLVRLLRLMSHDVFYVSSDPDVLAEEMDPVAAAALAGCLPPGHSPPRSSLCSPQPPPASPPLPQSCQLLTPQARIKCTMCDSDHCLFSRLFGLIPAAGAVFLLYCWIIVR